LNIIKSSAGLYWFKKSMTLILILLLTFLIPSNILSQQIDSVNSGWSGFISGEGLYQSGNTNKLYLQSKGELKADLNNFEGILYASYGYGEAKGRKDDNNFILSFTGDFFRTRKFTPFILQILEYNFAKGIDIKSQSGAGLKYTFIKNNKHKSSVSAAIIYDYTNLIQKPENYDMEIIRLSMRLKTRQELFDSRMILSFTGFYQPMMIDFSAHNIRIECSVDFPIVHKIYFRSSYLYTFEDVVSVGRKRADNKLTFGLGIGFGK